MNKSDIAKELLSKKWTRIELCRRSFKYFLLHYFSQDIRYPKLAPYHYDWIQAVEKQLNIYCQWHRESAKTTILWLAQEVRKICYLMTRFIANLCYDEKKAKEFNFILANILASNPKIKEDFGQLYKRNQRTIWEDDFMLRSWIWEFVTTTWIKVKAFGSGQTIRWEIHQHPKYGKVRPDHLNMDDLDNNNNTKNKTIIAEDMEFIKQEVFWGLDSNAQIVVLGNVIRSDWRNPRIRDMYKNNTRRSSFDNFVYWKSLIESWTPIWWRYVNTDKEAEIINRNIEDKDARVISLETKKANEMSWFNQNYLGIPMAHGQTVIELVQCKKIRKDQVPEKFDYVQIWWDPAFSLKNATDSFGIVVTWHKTVDKVHFKYVLKSVKLQWDQKKQENVESVFKQLYDQFKASRVKVENNNGWAVFARGIQKYRIAVDVVSATKDKLTRLKEYEWDFQRWQVFFLEWETEDLVSQLIDFTWESGNEDDLVDAMVWSFDGYQWGFQIRKL